jgi:Ca2+-binding EF-hand superfamily protein
MFDGGSGSIDVNGFAHLYGYVNQWMQTFRQYDRNQSGFIDSNEFMQALQTMGYRFSPQFAENVALKFGEKGAGLPVDGFVMACILIQKFTEGFRQKDLQQQGVITIAYEDFLSLVLNTW